MIQPINALTPRAEFRGSNETNGKKTKGLTSSKVALANAAGVSLAAGGATALIARAYTRSFSHAGVLGVFGAMLTMFFMTPHLIEKIGLNKISQNPQKEALVKQDLQKVAKDCTNPLKRVIQTRI